MVLDFTPAQQIFIGNNPALVHMPDNSIWGFMVENGRLVGENIVLEEGDINWEVLTLSNFDVVSSGTGLSFARFTHQPRAGTYAVWHQPAGALDRHTLAMLVDERVYNWNNDFMRGLMLGMNIEHV